MHDDDEGRHDDRRPIDARRRRSADAETTSAVHRAALPNFAGQRLACYVQIGCSATADIELDIFPEWKGTTTCSSVLTEAPTLRVHSLKGL